MLTLEQLIELAENEGIDIFSGLSLPEDSPLDRDTLINTIIMRCGMSAPMYADPSVFQSAINVWSAKNQYTFVHVGKIYAAEYSPIENKQYEYEHSTGRGLTDNNFSQSTRRASEFNVNNSAVEQGKTSTHSGTDTTRDHQNTSAYNSSEYQPKDEDVTTLEHGEKITDRGGGTTAAAASSNKQAGATQLDNKFVTENVKEKGKEHGNIGVSTNFDLQRGEYQLLTDFRPYDYLAGLFENELTLFVY